MSSGERRLPDPASSLAAETGKGSGGADGLPSRLERYTTARDRALVMRDHLTREPGEDAERAALRLSECGNYLKFRHYFTVDQIRLHGASFCKQHLICPLCAIRRGAKMLATYLERFHYLQASDPTLRPYLVTLTVKNGDHLGERFEHLVQSLSLLLKRRHIARVKLSALRHALAGLYSVEFTNRGNGWHPHVHMVVLAHEAPCPEVLAYEWHTITGDSFVVDVSRDESQPDAHMFLEVCKYALKFSDLTPEQTWLASRVLRGRRLVGTFGLFRGLVVPEDLNDEPLDGLPYVDLFFRYMRGRGYQFTGNHAEALHHA